MLQSAVSPPVESRRSGITRAVGRATISGCPLRQFSASLDNIFPDGFTRFFWSSTPRPYSRLRNPFIAGSMSCEHHQVIPQTFLDEAALVKSVVIYSGI